MSEIAYPGRPEPRWVLSWMSLLRTIRAPLGSLVLAGLALLVPPQTADMLAALDDGQVSASDTLRFHIALAFLAMSAWYWSRALLAARFDLPDDEAARTAFLGPNKRVYDAVPRLMYGLAVLIGIGLILRSGIWSSLAYLAAWAIPLGVAVHYRTRVGRAMNALMGRPPAAQAPPGDPSREVSRHLLPWLRNLPSRFWLLIRRAPWPNWISLCLIILSAGLFVWGTIDAFLPSDPDWQYPGLAVLAATLFPGPSVALIGLGLVIAPLAALTFLFDGLDISFTLFGPRVLRRPPVITILVGWTLIAPALFSLHTVRIIEPDGPEASPLTDRADLTDFFKAWAKACQPDNGQPVRPVIVAVSGGASRAAIWGERVLYEVEQATGSGGPRIFAVSSVSGGSLGVAAYMSALAGLPDAARCGTDDTARRQQMQLLTSRELSQDALGPLLAGTVLVDIPRSVLTPFPEIIRWISGAQPRGGDRAEAIEHGFERLWHRVRIAADQSPPIGFEKPFLRLFYVDHKLRQGMPIWIANGTDMALGGRLLTIPIDPKKQWPFLAADDALAALGADVPISTAINNTARFPYLEPSGELLPYVPPSEASLPPLDQRHQPDGTARQIIDGGYFDNEGLQTALDLAGWLEHDGSQAIGRPVQPIIVQASADGEILPAEDVERCEPLNDDPTWVSETARPLQFLAPVSGLYNVRGGHAAVLLREARDGFCADKTPPVYRCDRDVGRPVRCTTPEAVRQRFFHFYLPADGDKVVPLNWVLSDRTARFIWDDAMQQAGNPQEAWILHESLKVPEGKPQEGHTAAK